MSAQHEDQIQAVIDAIARPGRYAGRLAAFPSNDDHLRHQAVAVLVALDGVALQTAQES